MDADAATARGCRFCGAAIRSGDDLDPTRTAHAACVAAEHAIPADGERGRLLRQLWKLAKS
jgi:hypothetical protein